MYQSRLNRYQEKVLAKRLALMVGGIFAFILFLFFFGLKLLEGLGIASEFLQGSPQPTPKLSAYVAPPILNEFPEATNSAQIPITGKSEKELRIILYVNNVETVSDNVKEDGSFAFSRVKLAEGENTVKAKAEDAQGNKSETSNVLNIRLTLKAPELVVTSPESDKTVIGDNNSFTVSGKTDAGNSVTVNDRIAVVSFDGSFSYTMNLSEGDNTVSVSARDDGGNETKIVRKVTYHP
jgi:hypothetical protein